MNVIDPDDNPMTGAELGPDDVPPPAGPVPSIYPFPRFGDRAKERERESDPADEPEGERLPAGESPTLEGD